ncbi:tetratricopeptide repeat protein [Roseococcus suduntuyensis]|uniref:Tetratricopeptide repeat-containing protein n=1 Tax=Roseococcus suduntuyensis TaxID=455361 RepID=A0A840AGN5_9PROT|nr:tetratricopeptide repeat protein [Roseococcus suduntuyensis]MBB3899245.1 hypothetical protein [Roseococcus suduntuyensis]
MEDIRAQARALARQGSWEDAIRTISQGLDGATGPERPRLIIELAQLYNGAGQPEQALRLLGEQTPQLQDQPKAAAQRCMALLLLGRLPEAAALIQRWSAPAIRWSRHRHVFEGIYLAVLRHLRIADPQLAAAVGAQGIAIFPESTALASEGLFAELVKDTPDCSSIDLFTFYSFRDTRPPSLEEQKRILGAIMEAPAVSPAHRLNCAIAHTYKCLETDDLAALRRSMEFLLAHRGLVDSLGVHHSIRYDRFSVRLSMNSALWHAAIGIGDRVALEETLDYHLTLVEGLYSLDLASSNPIRYQSGYGIIAGLAVKFIILLREGDYVAAQHIKNLAIRSVLLVGSAGHNNVEDLLFHEFFHNTNTVHLMIRTYGHIIENKDPPTMSCFNDLFAFCHHLEASAPSDVHERFRAKFADLVQL